MSIEEVLFQPEQIEAMHAAFVIVCAQLRLRVGPRESDRVAARIVDLAKTGQHDAGELALLALSEMGAALLTGPIPRSPSGPPR
jgi:hypothetical protein